MHNTLTYTEFGDMQGFLDVEINTVVPTKLSMNSQIHVLILYSYQMMNILILVLKMARQCTCIM